MTYNPPPSPEPPQNNNGINFMGYSIGIGVILLIGLPILAVLVCCGLGVVGAASNPTDTSPTCTSWGPGGECVKYGP